MHGLTDDNLKPFTLNQFMTYCVYICVCMHMCVLYNNYDIISDALLQPILTFNLTEYYVDS